MPLTGLDLYAFFGLFPSIAFCLLLGCGFCRLGSIAGCLRFDFFRFAPLQIFLALGNIFSCVRNGLAPLLIKLAGSFITARLHRTGHTVSGIFRRGAFLGRYALLCLFLGTDIGIFHALSGNGGTVQGLDRAFHHVPCFNIRHLDSPARWERRSSLPQSPCGHWRGCTHR